MDSKTEYEILDPQKSPLVKDIIEDHDKRASTIFTSLKRQASQNTYLPSSTTTSSSPEKKVCFAKDSLPLPSAAIPSSNENARTTEEEETRTSAFPGSSEISTANDVVTKAAPGRFHCKLRALAHWPQSSFFRNVCGKCRYESAAEDKCCSSCGGLVQKAVVLQLRLGDDTGTFDAILAGKEAEYFFTGERGGGGGAGGELNEEVIVSSLNSILARSCDTTPNVDCQVLSYINEDGTKVCYALYETTVAKLK